jgi:hypothetical protein
MEMGGLSYVRVLMAADGSFMMIFFDVAWPRAKAG